MPYRPDFAESRASRREIVRRYIMEPEVYHDLAESFLAFRGFHPSSSESGHNPDMDRCVEKYINHVQLKNTYRWDSDSGEAQVNFDWNAEEVEESSGSTGHESSHLGQLKNDHDSVNP